MYTVNYTITDEVVNCTDEGGDTLCDIQFLSAGHVEFLCEQSWFSSKCRNSCDMCIAGKDVLMLSSGNAYSIHT